ncbi:Protein of unknown function [Gryllus bimaculatus]|nr:Protein of unknown function [Gryllus bimaculatus]
MVSITCQVPALVHCVSVTIANQCGAGLSTVIHLISVSGFGLENAVVNLSAWMMNHG